MVLLDLQDNLEKEVSKVNLVFLEQMAHQVNLGNQEHLG